MAIQKLPYWTLTNASPAFYDHESVTSIEGVAKIHGKMNELIDAYNAFVDVVNAEIEEFEGKTAEEFATFETGLRQEFQDFIDSVDVQNNSFQKQVDDTLMNIAANVDSTIAEEVAKKPLVLASHLFCDTTGVQVGYNNKITLNGNLADYDYFEVEGYQSSSSYPFKISGTYSTYSYDGAGIHATGVIYGSGGYWYMAAIHIKDDGTITGGIYDISRITDGFASSSAYITKITGYKF